MSIVTRDPKWVRPEQYNALERLFLPMLKDERDLIFIRVTALITLTVPTLAALLFLSEPWVIGGTESQESLRVTPFMLASMDVELTETENG